MHSAISRSTNLVGAIQSSLLKIDNTFFISYLFGLKQVSSAFQRIMSFVFNKAPNVTDFVYGVFNYSSNIENHLVNVQDASSDSLKSI